MNLLTGRQLVAELQRLGLGVWTSDAVRQWVREEPPCPIAVHADQGKPHRYNLLDVLRWLQSRAMRDRAKGYTGAGQAQLLERLELVLRQFVTGGGAAPTVPAQLQMPTMDPLPPPPPISGLSPAKKGEGDGFDFSTADELSAVLEVLRTNRPQVWRAVEAALNDRRKRMVEERKLVPIEDLQNTLDTMALAVRSAVQALIVPLAMQIPDNSSFEQRRVLLQDALDALLRRLAETDTEELARGLPDNAESGDAGQGDETP